MYYYIITPWKNKRLGKVLPPVVKRLGKKLWGETYILRYAVVLRFPEGEE